MATSIRDRVAGAIHLVAAALLVAAVTVMAVQVGLRLFFNAPLSWPEEVVRYSFVWIVYLGSAVAVSRDSHIRVLVMIDPYGPRVRRFSDGLSWLCNVFCYGFLLYWGADLAWKYKAAEFYTLSGWSQLWYYLALPIPMALAVFFLLTPSGRTAPSSPSGESPI
ncbi:MAG: Tripartite ATP-independent periplasmic transporter, DctQ component [Devosia sp.]|uniref:TRAP transporter small permease n=1 Tax=Devosia sp. TaxID=1871048 RepID=UPI0026169348|nr:TRAP transporter small permease [Devosia sp.]MDB5541225.1 Tripartite ATP-independent periplasmic transporter, DctQ component [Devosia sp.]